MQKNILTTSFVLYYHIVFKFRGKACGGLKYSDHTVNYCSASENKFKALDPTLNTCPSCFHKETYPLNKRSKLTSNAGQFKKNKASLQYASMLTDSFREFLRCIGI